MNIAEAKQQVRDTVEAYLAKDETGIYAIPKEQQRPLFLLGSPGIGKTAIMGQIADELGIGLVSYSMTHHTRQSMLGLPFIVHRKHDGIEYDASEYTMSEIIASIYDYMDETGLEQGILFLDEINCVSETLYPSMLQFLQFKTFGRHKVPDDWVVVCAGNPPEYNRSVHEFDIVTLDRLRKIEVEADYGAWRAYAQDNGVHPAIMSFLEIKRDCFYSVESTPEGKAFVTARGWDDLSQVITVYEEMGKPVDAALISQFVQDPEIADRFAVYYDLFDKYRSDYQVERILAGEVSDQIETRAREAAFDEKLALVGLMLDSISRSCSEALEQKAVLTRVRDVLRGVKERAGDDADVEAELGEAADALRATMRKDSDSSIVSKEQDREDRLELSVLKELAGTLSAERDKRGPQAFGTVEAAYMERVGQLEGTVAEASSKIDNAYAFNDRSMGNDRACLVFTTELTSRRVTSGFISEFGSDSYYEHNKDLLVDEHREDLIERIDQLRAGDDGDGAGIFAL